MPPAPLVADVAAASRYAAARHYANHDTAIPCRHSFATMLRQLSYHAATMRHDILPKDAINMLTMSAAARHHATMPERDSSTQNHASVVIYAAAAEI